MWNICKKEINQFFSSLTGYIAVILFLLINGMFLFLLQDSNIFDFGYASLDKFFELAPWVFIFLVPAVAMRSFSDEFRTGTFEILKTKPVTSLQIVLGKYFSVILVVVIALIPTLLYVFTIKTLSVTGAIDKGGIAGSYLGLIFLSAVFSAISICCGSFTSNAIVSFLISAFMCLVLYFGFNAISSISVFSGNADYYIEMLGIDFHYQSISRGVVDSRDLTYFLSLIILSIFITQKKLKSK
jgi:ABC-2 type transport system permease protein